QGFADSQPGQFLGWFLIRIARAVYFAANLSRILRMVIPFSFTSGKGVSNVRPLAISVTRTKYFVFVLFQVTTISASFCSDIEITNKRSPDFSAPALEINWSSTVTAQVRKELGYSAPNAGPPVNRFI